MTVNSTHYHGPGGAHSYTGGVRPQGRYGGMLCTIKSLQCRSR